MKKFAVVVVLIALGAGLFFVFKSKNPRNLPDATAIVAETNSPATAATKNSGAVPTAAGSVAAAMATNEVTAPTASSNSAAMTVSSLPPLTVLDNARVTIHNYNGTFGENPVGTNQEITEALMGKNPKGITFITEESGLRVNENGEMVDAWGTPFFFHQISGSQMEIRSAGMDRKMWTFDDLVTR
jgi:hypothetical protein